jgi:hypothetical protein
MTVDYRVVLRLRSGRGDREIETVALMINGEGFRRRDYFGQQEKGWAGRW